MWSKYLTYLVSSLLIISSSIAITSGDLANSTEYSVFINLRNDTPGIDSLSRKLGLPEWTNVTSSISEATYEASIDVSVVESDSVAQKRLRQWMNKRHIDKIGTSLRGDQKPMLLFALAIPFMVVGLKKGEEATSLFCLVSAVTCEAAGLTWKILSDKQHNKMVLWARTMLTNNPYAYQCSAIPVTITDLHTGQEHHLERETNFVDTEPFNHQFSRQISDMIEDFFLELRSETVPPQITFNQPTEKVRATYLRIPLQLTDDVELSEVTVKSPRFNESHLLGGYKQKTEYFEVPLTVGENTISITVTDWCGKTASDVIQIFALKDSDNTTYTLGDLPDDDIVIVEDEIIIEETNIDIDIPQTSMVNQDAVALVIGNRDYEHRDVPSVDYAIRDAQTIRQYLIQTLGYPSANIIYLENAGLSHLRTAVLQLANQVETDVSDVFVYYSGHGAPSVETEKGYLLPVDCNPDFVETGGYSLDEFYEVLSNLPSRHTYAVIDACFSGRSAGGTLLGESSPVYIQVDSSAFRNSNVTLLTSSSGKQISSWYPEKSHSLFTYYFLRALHGDADLNGNQQLTFDEIREYIESNVPAVARRLHNREQTPQFFTKDKGRILVEY